MNDESQEELKKGDYINVVINAIGDGMSAIPAAGAFITAVKNVGVNLAAARQTNRIISLLTELANRVKEIELKFKDKCNDDAFLIMFYRLLYYSRDEIDSFKHEAYINLGKRLLEETLPFDLTQLAINTLPLITSHEIKLLQHIAAYAPEWKNSDSVANDIETQAVIGTTNPQDVKLLLAQLWRRGLLKESHHGARLGSISSENIESFVISIQGENLLRLLG